jgi:hypothetical protein
MAETTDTAVEMAGILKTRKDEFPTPPLTTLRKQRSELLTLPQPLLLLNIGKKEDKRISEETPAPFGGWTMKNTWTCCNLKMANFCLDKWVHYRPYANQGSHTPKAAGGGSKL